MAPYNKQPRSGYEPSDTETEWQDDQNSGMFVTHKSNLDSDLPRNISPFRKTRGSSKSPYKTQNQDVHLRNVSPISVRRNISTSAKTEHQSRNQKTPNREERATERSSHTRRSATALKQRIREKEQRKNQEFTTPSRSLSDRQRELTKSPEVNEMVAGIKYSGTLNAPYLESIESNSPGDIFFSQIGTGKPNLVPNPPGYSQKDSKATKNVKIEQNRRRTLTNSSPMMSSYAASGQSNGKFSSESAKTSGTSKTSLSSKQFVENRKKKQAESWFSCVRRGPCRTSRSPEKQCFDEASFIERAFLVETLREFWADKHRPATLNGFICHKQEAQLLKQLASQNNIPHVLMKGPSGSGKRSLARALLSEIFGNSCQSISHELRYFQVQEQRAMKVACRIASSAHHIELNLDSEPNAKYALMGLVKEFNTAYAAVPEVSSVTLKPDYKVLVLYQVDKATDNVQHLIKWILDCYTDACKLILCCEDSVDILKSVTNQCKVIQVDAPVTHEIMEVLIQIARKEDFDLPIDFAARIAAKSKQNLRRAIMTLEACKAHNYPFADDQPIPSRWEEVLVELAADILSDPSQKRLFMVRGKIQKLLVDFVHPKLILLKLVEQFLQGVEASTRRELYYWHAYYDKRIPTGSSALLKLEEFVAKFMGLHRRSLTGRS